MWNDDDIGLFVCLLHICYLHLRQSIQEWTEQRVKYRLGIDMDYHCKFCKGCILQILLVHS